MSGMEQHYKPYLKETLINETELAARVQELGEQISADYQGTEGLLLICILKGGVMFLTDLTKHLSLPHEIDFMAVSSYGAGARHSSGRVRIDMDLTADLKNKHVLIVEDIIDSGHTLEFVLNMLRAREPASIKLVALLDKASRREVDIQIDYIGFEIEDKFVFGYGLDLDEKFRNLPFIGVVDLGMLEDE
jgi:hypoxanthine phosphoribosyltransferase